MSRAVLRRYSSLGTALCAVLALSGGVAAAQTPLTAFGASKNVTVTLVPENDAVRPGRPVVVGIHLKMAPEWHTYWKNPGDSGLPTRVKWRLPEGFEAGPLQWPRPERIPADPLMSYGYEGEVLLLTEIRTPAETAASEVRIGARVDWLECKEACLPGKAELEIRLPVREAPRALEDWAASFRRSRQLMPAEPAGLTAEALASGERWTLVVKGVGTPGSAYFFPATNDVLDHAAPQELATEGGAWRLSLARATNAAPTSTLRGVLELDGRAYEIQAPVSAAQAQAGPGTSQASSGGGASQPAAPGGVPAASAAAQAEVQPGQAAPAALAGSGRSSDQGRMVADSSTAPRGRAPLGGVARSLPVALAFAFIGGLILNLMPCVLPVLSLKVMGFVRHGADSRAGALRHGVAFAAGVLAFFWILAGALLALRAGGEQIGWGFQLQSPPFVVFLSGLFLLVALNLFGVFEVGQSLSAAANLAAGQHGLASSFWSGALATIVATPCTAPFMGSALGFALSEPAASTLLVFTSLGLGMAAPYLLLAASPRLLKLLPRPGRWMETFKQAMGFPMLATVVFLVWLFGRQTGVNAMSWMLLSLLLIGMGAWLYGRGGTPSAGRLGRVAAAGGAFALVAAGLSLGISKAQAAPPAAAARAHAGAWEPYSEARLRELRASGTPVFVDFTADWCLTCQVNHRVALAHSEVQARFRDLGIVLMKADWTLRDAEITRALQAHGRQGVPLYVLYGRDPDAAPRLLPEVLTPGLVLDTLAEAF